jgi:hypothetical protein
MNGFKEHGLDEDAFSAKGNIVSAFDAFRTFPPSTSNIRRGDKGKTNQVSP